ncbi:LSU ribosomal protein L3P [Thermodesulforhabdus norvegica]|uniref:Large ribosomal subunit protein uL3 n=2 Tax=Thermodesulforhabdus norvegica TaxID=39841 RepID=A0A1I4VNE1_9BACT|nr:LSU ribosomal protein L3P [Thermodesulforhabdus norvegica]
MIRGLIGRKLGMTQVFAEDGSVVPVTVLEVGPCVVTQVKTVDRDGYQAVQLGFGVKKAKNVTRPLQGHMKKALENSGREHFFAVLKEFRVDDVETFEVGQEIRVEEVFQIGERVDVIGRSKGRGFAGTIKRWGFSRGPMTHGCKNIREPGSTGCATFPGRVIKGKKMPGHYGNERVTVLNLRIVDIRPEENVILVKGAVPGAPNGTVLVRKTNRVK